MISATHRFVCAELPLRLPRTCFSDYQIMLLQDKTALPSSMIAQRSTMPP